MTRVYIIVEGRCEEEFIRDVLSKTLWGNDVALTAVVLGDPGHKGGNPVYQRVKKDVIRQLTQERGVYCSTMLDFYGLGKDFPGKPLPPNISNAAKADRIERAFHADICARLPDLRPDLRFLPYIQLHEYEALLFSDCLEFAATLGKPALAGRFQKVRHAFESPEDINDSPDTAPSKRVLQIYPSYRKPLHGTPAASAVGIDAMERECPHFRAWIARLRALPPL